MLLPSFILNQKGDLQRLVANIFGDNQYGQVFQDIAALSLVSFCGLGLFSLFILFIVASCGWPAKRKNHWTCYLQIIAIIEALTLTFFVYRYFSEFYWPNELPNIFFWSDFSCRILTYLYNWLCLVDNWIVVALTIDSYMAMFTTLRLFGGEIGDRRIGWLIISIIGISSALLLIPDVVLVHLYDSRSQNTAARALFYEQRRFAIGFPITDSCWSGVVPYDIGYRQVGLGLIVGFLIPFCCVFTMNVTILKYSNRKLYRGSAQARHGKQFLPLTFYHIFAQVPLACFSVYALIVRYLHPTQNENQLYQLAEFFVFEFLPITSFASKLYLCIAGSGEFRKCCCCYGNRGMMTSENGRLPGDDGIRRLGGLLSSGPHHQALLEEQDNCNDCVRIDPSSPAKGQYVVVGNDKTSPIY